MPNPYFQFKQFTVYQDKSALKVSTDSCIFGAWVARKVAGSLQHMNACLDIGAGSGLLMLMLAQQFQGPIDGVEIDRASSEQATENIAASPWYHRLRVYHHDIKLFALPHQYDLIISNPPFYEGDLKSVNQRYNFAKHNDGLSLADLLELADRNLSAKGQFAVLLPYQRMEWFQQQAMSHDLFVAERLLVQQSPQHPYFRAVLLLNRVNAGQTRQTTLAIRQTATSYTPGFIALLKDYYLHL